MMYPREYYPDPSLKMKFHRDAKKHLRLIADKLGLAKGSYDIRSNKAGPAIMGEVVLHTDTLYVDVSGERWIGEDPTLGVMYRSVKGRKDYSGGQNYWLPMGTFRHDIDGTVERFRKVAGL